MSLFDYAAGIIDGERDAVANMANVAAVIFDTLADINWAGFYIVKDGGLVLGPFQGKPACIRIPFDRGVCGAAAREMKTQLVKNVHEFPGHIACDSASLSELVVPIIKEGRLIGVIDIDSPLPARFSEADAKEMAGIARLMAEGCDWREDRI